MVEERRKAERKQTDNFFGVYHRETNEYLGRLFDMSTKGILILAVRAMNVNSTYEFRIDLPKPIAGKSCLIFNAECVWCRESTSSSKGWDAGFHINDINFEDIKTIQYLLNDPLFLNSQDQPRVTLIEKPS